jgi:hypothetical protein
LQTFDFLIQFQQKKHELKEKYQGVKNSAGDASNQSHCPGNGRQSGAETGREFKAIISQKTRPM